MNIKLTDLDIRVILDEKPYNLDTAMNYADMLTLKYNKLYCVIKYIDDRVSKNRRRFVRKKKYSIIGFNHFRDNIPLYELYYITKKDKPKKLILDGKTIQLR